MMATMFVTEHENCLLLAALRYFRRRAEDSHLLEELHNPASSYSEVASIATMQGKVAIPTLHAIQELEVKLGCAAEPGWQPASMWAVVLLEGGLLHSLTLSADNSVTRRRFEATCRSCDLSLDDPRDEDREVYHERLVPSGQEYFLESDGE